MDFSPLPHIHPTQQVDLTKIIETQSFTFDDAFDAAETNEMMYSRTISPLVAFLFDGGKASCFAYGQTGSGTCAFLFLLCVSDGCMCECL
jgi:Kinesin motor domain